MKFERDELVKLVASTTAFSLFFGIVCLSTMFFLPNSETGDAEQKVAEAAAEEVAEIESPKVNEQIDVKNLFPEDSPVLVMDTSVRNDYSLDMYRDPSSKHAVEWYYSRVTNNREVAMAILRACDEYGISPSLAFALAHTESRFKVTAVHKNTNGTIDRGIFQLNNSSFPKLSESDFYDPNISAHYGLSHLKFCMNTAGNEVAALAMYNAGTNKVRKNNTPQITLDYISQIQKYKAALEETFVTEVLTFYNPDNISKMVAKK